MKIQNAVLPLLFAITLNTSAAFCQVNEPINADYITSDTYFITVIHPQKILSHLDKENATIEYLQEVMTRNAGFDLKKLKSCQVLFAGSGDDEGSEKQVAIVLIFTDKVEIDDISSKMFGGFDYSDDTLEGQSVKKPDGGNMPYFWNPDGKTIVLAEEARMTSLIKNKNGMPTGTALSRKINQDHDFACVIDFNDFSPSRRETVSDMVRFWLPEAIELDEIESMASSCFLSVRCADNVPISLSFEAKDDASAAKLKSTVETAWDQGKEKIDEIKEEIKEDVPTEMEKTAEVLLRAMEIFKTEAKVVANGNTVSVKIERMQGFKELAEMIAELVAMPFRMFDSF
jgi:hypothetical protein